MIKSPHLSIVALAWLASPCLAYLGDFEAQDGYKGMLSDTIASQAFLGDWQDGTGYVPAALDYTFGPPDLYQRAGPDVSRYNAGAYGTNNSGPGGIGADIVDNSGQWKALAGGRLTVDATNGLSPLNFIAAHGGAAKSGANYLAVRAIDATLSYDYSVDSRDFGGISPLSLTGGTYSVGFWFCPGQVISPAGPGTNIFGLSFKDGVGTNGFGFGYNGQGQVQFDLGGAGLWSGSGVTVGANDWSYASIQIDTATDTVSMSITPWDDLSSSLGASVQVLSHQSMNTDMSELQTMNWRLNAGMDKNFFDNFNMSVTAVPEPGSALLIMFASIGLLSTHRRRLAL